MNLKIESYRKFLHFLLIIIPLIFLTLGRPTTILILAPITLFIVSLDYLRRRNVEINIFFNKIFGVILREHEKQGDKLCGASFVFLAATINFFIFKPEIAVTGFLILVISDALAAIVGKAYPSRPFFEKSAIGSLVFFVSALIILISCGIFFDTKFSFYFFGLFAVFCVTIIEARPTFIGIDDNFTIPIVFAVEMSFFDLLWNYSY
jgi:dolichol kinase